RGRPPDHGSHRSQGCGGCHSGGNPAGVGIERFPAKWKPVRVKKTRQNKNLEPRSDSIGTEKALGYLDQDMVRESEVREGELTVDMPPARDAGLVFVGRIRTPWKSRLDTPRQGRLDGPVCRLEIFEPWVPAIKGVDFYESLEVIYWLHQS